MLNWEVIFVTVYNSDYKPEFYFAYNQLDKSHFPYKKVMIMDKTSNISTLTTIGIDRQTGKLIDKLCKRYSLKKGEIVRLAFVYIDKACIF